MLDREKIASLQPKPLIEVIGGTEVTEHEDEDESLSLGAVNE